METALFALLGVIFGACLQYYFTRHLENEKHLRDLRTQSYTDYLNSVAKVAKLKGDSAAREILFAEIADAKCRISLYASPAVIEAFAIFEKEGATLISSKEKTAFIEMITRMRADSGGKGKANPDDIAALILGYRH
ncbi:MAG: hypothetical protein AAGA45_07480 [Verrucomicrobiota bacterium]